MVSQLKTKEQFKVNHILSKGNSYDIKRNSLSVVIHQQKGTVKIVLKRNSIYGFIAQEKATICMEKREWRYKV